MTSSGPAARSVTRKIRWSVQARDYLLNEIRRPEKRTAILDAVSYLKDYPEMYPFARSKRYTGFRAMAVVYPLVLLYRVTDESIDVVAIIDGRRRF